MTRHLLAILVLLLSSAVARGQTLYGEPVALKGRHIYFTSWKYVRQGQFGWGIEKEAARPVGPNEQAVGAWLKGDGSHPARFEPSDMPHGIRLVAQPATKVPFKPPFNPGQFAGMLADDGKYKAWYTVSPCAEAETFSTKDRILPGDDCHVAYAESVDGSTWTTPNLGLFEYAGSRDNNIVFRGDVNGSLRGYHGGSVFLDPSSREERYKMFYLGGVTDDEWAAFEKKYPGEADPMARRPDVAGYRCVVAVFGAVSADGIHWKSLPEPLMIQHADTINSCYYDLDLKKYVAYVRVWQVNPLATGYDPKDSNAWIAVGRRSIGRSVSSDFCHFSKPEIVVGTSADMAPSHVWYTNGKTTLPDCPDNHVMFPWLWEMERDAGSVWLLSSPNGQEWSRVPGGPVVSPGNTGQPDGAYVICSGQLLEYPDGLWGIPYRGEPIPHKYPGRDLSLRKGLYPGVDGISGLATWPAGRLVALRCEEEGEFATVAIIPPGERIRLNAVIAPTGYIKVAVRQIGRSKDLPGRGFEDADRLVGDSLAMNVTWDNDQLVHHEGRPIILRFRMRQADLFGVEFY